MSETFGLDPYKQRKFVRKLNSQSDLNVQDSLEDLPPIKNNIDQCFSADCEADQMTPLTFATSKNRNRICEMLVDEYNAKPNYRDMRGKTALEIAHDKGNHYLVNFFSQFVDDAPPPPPSPPRKPEHPRRVPPPAKPLQHERKIDDTDVKIPEPTQSFKLFSNIRSIQRIISPLRDWRRKLFEAASGSTILTQEMRDVYDQDAVKDLLKSLHTFYEEQKKLLLNEQYFQSMLETRGDGYDEFIKMDWDYSSAWVDARKNEKGWNERIEDIQRWYGNRSYNGTQPLADFVQIYPFAVTTQNRVNQIISRLAQETDGLAEDGLYLPSDGPKSLDRAFEKQAFCSDPERLYKADVWDFCRGLITYNTLKNLIEAIDVFDDESFSEVEIVNVSCTFKKKTPGENARQASARWRTSWQDVKVHFWFVDDIPRIICELQLCLAPFTNARRAGTHNCGGHEAYAKFRCVDEIERFMKDVPAEWILGRSEMCLFK